MRFLSASTRVVRRPESRIVLMSDMSGKLTNSRWREGRLATNTPEVRGWYPEASRGCRAPKDPRLLSLGLAAVGGAAVGEGDEEAGAALQVELGPGAAAHPLHRLAHDAEAQAGALHPRDHVAVGAEEAGEELLPPVLGDAQAVVRHLDH